MVPPVSSPAETGNARHSAGEDTGGTWAGAFPRVEEFSRSNIYRLRAFYEAWGQTAGEAIVPQAVGRSRETAPVVRSDGAARIRLAPVERHNLMPRRWNIPAPDPAAAELAGRLRVSPLIGQILLNRGLSDPELCRQFLMPSLAGLHDPSSLPGLTQAAERIAQAITAGQKIVIYGDYDVDGMTATSILWHAIKTLGGKADYYIPRRIEEGYGLNAQAIESICTRDGAGLIVSVDCGITATDPARRVARELGGGSDHHRSSRMAYARRWRRWSGRAAAAGLPYHRSPAPAAALALQAEAYGN